jgi:hypothetical protein
MDENDAWVYIWENIKKQEKPIKMKEYEIKKDINQREELKLKDINYQLFKPYHEYEDVIQNKLIELLKTSIGD